jgi:hypothetical protein
VFAQDYVDFAAGLAQDRGGFDELSTAERALIESVAETRALRRKCGRNVLARGLARRDGELRGPVKVYIALVNAERQGLLALGLGRRARDVQTLDSYLRERAAAGRGEAIDTANGAAPEGDGDRPVAANADAEAAP